VLPWRRIFTKSIHVNVYSSPTGKFTTFLHLILYDIQSQKMKYIYTCFCV